MTDILSTGKFYLGGGIVCRKPGRYTTRDEFAQFLVATEGHQFAIAKEQTEKPQGTHSEPSDNSAPVRLSKMSRAQLEAVAAEIGLKVTDDIDSNAMIRHAIEAHQSL